MHSTKHFLLPIALTLISCSDPAALSTTAAPMPPEDAAADAPRFEASTGSDAQAEAGPSACVHPDVVADCHDGWCRIPAGCFVMGSPPGEYGRGKYSETQVQVTLTHPFLMQQHEMTQAEWTALGYDNPSTAKPYLVDCQQPDCPVGNVNYFEALDFANSLSDAEGLPDCYAFQDCHEDARWGMVCNRVWTAAPSVYECDGYRLPTEAEWEYAARAGTTTTFYSGDITRDGPIPTADCVVDPNLEPIAWYCANSGTPPSTHPVMQKLPNGWGLYDMLGNAGEWVNDRFKGLGYGTEPLVDPDGLPSWDALNMTRGCVANAWPSLCRVAYHMVAPPDSRDAGVGFRLVRTLHDASK